MAVSLSPAFTTFASGKCRYRPRVKASLNGIPYFADGWDRPYYWPGSGSTLYDMGSDAPAHATLPSTAGFFTVADAPAGTAFPAGTTITLKLVFRNTTRGKETAPEEQWADAEGTVRTAYVVHTMAGTKDAKVTWTGANVPAEFDKVAIYRALLDEDVFYLDQEVTASTGTATLSTVDDDLALNRVYVPRYAITKPSADVVGVVAHRNRLWLWDELQPRLLYGQVALTGSDRVDDDIPPENILDIAPQDSNGLVRAVAIRYGALNVYKPRACYEVTGTDPLTFAVRRLFANRGALNQRCVVAVDGSDVVLDEIGVYFSVPNAEPVVAGVAADGSGSAMDPYFARMNLSARRYFNGVYDPVRRVVLFAVALDFDPVPGHVVVFDPSGNRFIGIDTLRNALAWGFLADAQGTLHLCHGDDLGFLWASDYGESEGIVAGDANVPVASATTTTVTITGTLDTTIDGAPGTPYQRFSAAEALLDSNRVYAAAAGTIDPLYFSTSAAASTQRVSIGIVAAHGQLPKLSWDNDRKKDVVECRAFCDQGAAGTLRIESAVDDGAFALKREITLSDSTQFVVPVNDRCWHWTVRFRQIRAGNGFALRSIHVRSFEYEDRAP